MRRTLQYIGSSYRNQSRCEAHIIKVSYTSDGKLLVSSVYRRYPDPPPGRKCLLHAVTAAFLEGNPSVSFHFSACPIRLAIPFLAGSMYKVLRRKRQLHLSSSELLQQRQRSSASQTPPAAAGAAEMTPVKKHPGLLTVASPGKTWVGVTGSIALGTATALTLEQALLFLLHGPLLSRVGESLPGEEEKGGVFSVGGMSSRRLGGVGAGLCVVGVVGDLWESLLKRTAMVKVSAWTPGQSLCFVAVG